MKVTRKTKATERLENLETGMVFTLPNNTETTYMVINEHDYYIDYGKVGRDEVMFIDLEDGEILTLGCDTEVVLLNGSFVISDD